MSKSVIIGAVILLGIVSGAVFLVHGEFASGKGSSPAASSLDVAAMTQVEREIQGVGYVEPVSEVRNLTFKEGGVVAECRAKAGQHVRAGDVLMVLNDAAERKALAVAEQELELAKASRDNVLAGVDKFEIAAAEDALDIAKQKLNLAEKEYRRIDALTEKSVTTKSEQDQSTTKYKQARAEFRQAEAQLQHLRHFVTPERQLIAERRVSLASARRDQAAQALTDMKLVAPVNGTILEVLKREGEAVSAVSHDPVIVFGDLSHLRVRAEIDERFVRIVKPGQAATVFGRTLNDQKYQGKVVFVKDLMGKRTVFTRSSTERKDLDVVQVFIEMGDDFTAPVGLRVDVAIDVGHDPNAIGSKR
jgi:HlyD family secretion protein